MDDGREGIFGGDDPFALARVWLDEARAAEVNDPNAMALATVDASGLPNARMVLLKDIEDDAFVFFTNYDSAKGREIEASGRAAFVMHWKSLRRQVRARGAVEKVSAEESDRYFKSRPLQSRVGAIASAQSRPLSGKPRLVAEAAKVAARWPLDPPRPENWGGYRIRPVEIEFWADGAFRMHDRFRWTRDGTGWKIARLYP